MAATISIDVRSNAEARVATLDDVQKRQLPFAVALSLSDTAWACVQAQQAAMFGRFTIRNPRTIKGIQREKAKKRDWPSPWAEVGSLDDFMLLQEIGGDKTARDSKRVTRPEEYVQKKATGLGHIPNLVRARPLRDLKSTFLFAGKLRGHVGHMPPGSEPEGRAILYKRMQGRQRKRVVATWDLRPSVHVKPRLGLYKTVEETAIREYPKDFTRALAHALATAKPQGAKATP